MDGATVPAYGARLCEWTRRRYGGHVTVKRGCVTVCSYIHVLCIYALMRGKRSTMRIGTDVRTRLTFPFSGTGDGLRRLRRDLWFLDAS